jgi:hypothetical protein
VWIDDGVFVMTNRSDHKVTYRTEQQVASHALAVRRSNAEDNNVDFNIKAAIDRLVGKEIGKDRRLFIIDFVQSEEIGGPAEVVHSPTTIRLRVDPEIYETAGYGDPNSRYILAHELAHVLMHDHHALRFSDDRSVRLKPFEKEVSAEWQAEAFADRLLIPDVLLSVYETADHLAAACSAPLHVAERRKKQHDQSRAKRRTGDICITCASYSVARNGVEFICEECKTIWC